ncbi:Polycomb protein Asx [Portunus trituberculatus]|uniref:Polycomb protein Asx n=1 Tax=Portunus trituberculatus TaxID=210409 RepID=A0A5B7E768_PORTR|nr:Polycomb protein Asx [Portunus trituberculatus]
MCSPFTLQQSVASGGTMTVKLTKGRTPGVVNIQRSYEIVQAVIANSPNRDQLQAQLKTPASLLAEVKPALNNAGVNSALVVNSTNANDTTTTMMVVSHASCGTITNNHLMMLHPNNNGNGPLLVSIPPDHQPSKSCPNPKGTSSLLSTHLSTSPVSPLGFGTPNSFQTAHLMPVPTSSVSLSNCRPLLVQTEACEGSMAPPLASTRPITILRQSPSGRPLVVRMPVSGLQVLRLGSRANPSGDCNSSSDSGNQQQQQHPPRAASAPPNKSGVMVALSPRPSSVGPRIVVQTSNAQVSPASILNTSGHFLSEGDPSSGVSNCDNTQFITTRAGASPSLYEILIVFSGDHD